MQIRSIRCRLRTIPQTLNPKPVRLYREWQGLFSSENLATRPQPFWLLWCMIAFMASCGVYLLFPLAVPVQTTLNPKP